MSVATSTAIGIGLAAGTGAAQIYASKKQGDANEKAIESQERANTEASAVNERATTEALAFEREKEARRQQEWDRMMAEEEARWNADQERLAPYRAASEGALSQLVSLAGLPAYAPTPVSRPNFDRPMPEAWQPGDPTGLEGETTDRAVVRKPTSARLTDLLNDPSVGGELLHTATAMGSEAIGRERDPSEPEGRVSPEAYRRVAAEAGATAPPLPRRRSPSVADLARPRDMFARAPTALNEVL